MWFKNLYLKYFKKSFFKEVLIPYQKNGWSKPGDTYLVPLPGKDLKNFLKEVHSCGEETYCPINIELDEDVLKDVMGAEEFEKQKNLAKYHKNYLHELELLEKSKSFEEFKELIKKEP